MSKRPYVVIKDIHPVDAYYDGEMERHYTPRLIGTKIYMDDIMTIEPTGIRVLHNNWLSMTCTIGGHTFSFAAIKLKIGEL